MKHAQDVNVRPTLEQLENRVALSHGLGGALAAKLHVEHSHFTTRNMGGGGGGMGPCGVQVQLNGTFLIIKGTKLFDNVTIGFNSGTARYTITYFPICANDPPTLEFDFIDLIKFDGGKGGDTFNNFTEIPSIVHGDADDDTIMSGGGADTILGGGGDDSITCATGDDIAFGGSGHDTLLGLDGLDSLYGNAGDDWIEGGDDLDFLNGNAGADQLYGNHGNIDSSGTGYLETDANYLNGGGDNDTLHGTAGNDSVYGGAGGDVLWSHAGADLVDGGKQADTVYCNIDVDHLEFDLADTLVYEA